MIRFDGVTFRYPYEKFDVLKNVCFSAGEGVSTVLADMQSGKTTLCKLLTGDIKQQSGQILYYGKPLESITPAERGILYLPAFPLLFGHRSVRYNLEYPLRIRRTDKKHIRLLTEMQAEKFGLYDKLDVAASKLSEEERQCLAVARGTLRECKTVLLDGFADKLAKDRLQRLLQMFGERESSVIIFTCNAETAAGNVVVLDGGANVFEGTKEEAEKFVKTLFWLSQRKENI